MVYMRYGIVVLSVLILILGVLLVLLIPTQLLLHGELGAIKTHVQNIKATSTQVQLDEELSTIQNTLGDLEKKLVFADTRPLYKTAKIILANPREGITISSFDIAQTAGSVHIVGIARDRAVLEAMIVYLQKIPGVTSVDSPLSNFIKSKQSPFSLTILL